jgi:hypothetical protein
MKILKNAKASRKYGRETNSNEQKCKQVAARVHERLKGDLIVKVCCIGKKWMIRLVGKKLAAAA